jgi:hypothetical protein
LRPVTPHKLTLFSNYLLILILSQINVCDYPRIRSTEFLVFFSIAAIGMNEWFEGVSQTDQEVAVLPCLQARTAASV